MSIEARPEKNRFQVRKDLHVYRREAVKKTVFRSVRTCMSIDVRFAKKTKGL